MFFHTACHSTHNKTAHTYIVQEMQQRGIEHFYFDKLDQN